MTRSEPDRRSFLRRSLGTLGTVSALQALAMSAGPCGGSSGSRRRSYGPLAPALDASTGLPLLRLPEGFWYTSFGWTDDPLVGGAPTPPNHDGMAVVGQVGSNLVLVRNHEVGGIGTPFGDPAITFDANAAGGTVTLLFDPAMGMYTSSAASLVGTVRNCAGGPTPWGSWLSCEETTDGTADGFDEDHGWIFEVPADQGARPVPLVGMGRFLHEAVAVDPATGIVYETEDRRHAAGLYRFTPVMPNTLFGLEQGGALEMLAVVGQPNADLQEARTGDEFQVEWVLIDDPAAPPQSGVGPFTGFDGEATSASGPFLQGDAKGAARFRRLEGAWAGDGGIYFVDTEGGVPAPDSGKPEGSVWFLDPAAGRLRVVFESAAAATLDNPDNMTLSPRGGLVLCEDGQSDPSRLHGLSSRGDLFTFAESDVVLAGEKNGISGDFRGSEWAGACFDPSGEWLFVNLQRPGITFAVTGPWGGGLL